MNLQAFKFDTKILENGIIKVPEFKHLVNQEIEIFVVLKNQIPTKQRLTADEFIQKWAGFLSEPNTDDLKFSYLNEKYQ